MKRDTTLFTIALACTFAAGQVTVARGAPEELDDREISIAVETELLLDEAVPSHRIDIDTRQGVVTLSGSVDSYYAKLEAEQEAEAVKGVVAVVNNIDVRPIVRLDSEIRTDIIAALAADSVTESFEVDVAVNNGVVSLTGEVDSYTEKSVAEEVAADVRGVTDVRNQITYDLVGTRSDSDIENDIVYRLKSDSSIDSKLIKVSVEDGQVTLSGSAGSALEKSEAATEAWAVPGVVSVANKVEVEWWLDGEDWDANWTDLDIKHAVDTALLANPRVSSFDVVTTVVGGIATLTGTVDNLAAKQAAAAEAEDVLGVRRVKNFLRVRPTPDRRDEQIANDIREALKRNSYVDRFDIGVNVYNGDVHLVGGVDSWFMKAQAEEAAASVSGVVAINNRLDVNYEFTAKTDREIREDIESQLFWSPFVDSDDIQVEVHSGVATLTGSVEDLDELRAARENALQGGATSVIADLAIQFGPDAG